MKSVIFTICLMGIFLFFAGCGDNAAKRRPRLVLDDRYETPVYYDSYYPTIVQRMRLPKIRPMALPPENQKNNRFADNSGYSKMRTNNADNICYALSPCSGMEKRDTDGEKQ